MSQKDKRKHMERRLGEGARFADQLFGSPRLGCPIWQDGASPAVILAAEHNLGLCRRMIASASGR